MQNVLSLTDFIRSLAGRPLGFSAMWIVPDGKGYRDTTKILTSTAGREGLKISVSQALIVDPQALTTLEAVKVTVK